MSDYVRKKHRIGNKCSTYKIFIEILKALNCSADETLFDELIIFKQNK